MANNPTMWHHRRDTLIYLTGTSASTNYPHDPQGGVYDVHLPVGVQALPTSHNVVLEYVKVHQEADRSKDPKTRLYRDRNASEPTRRIGFDVANPYGHIVAVTRDYIGHLRYERRKAGDTNEAHDQRVRPYLLIEKLLDRYGVAAPRYYDATLTGVEAGQLLVYRFVLLGPTHDNLYLPSADHIDRSGWYHFYVTSPKFTYDDVIGSHTWNETEDPDYQEKIATDASVVYSKRDEQHGIWHIRIDVDDIDRELVKPEELTLQLRLKPGVEPQDRRLQAASAVSRPTFARFAGDPDQPWKDFTAPIAESWRLHTLPLIHQEYSYLVVSLPNKFYDEIESIKWRCQEFKLRDAEGNPIQRGCNLVRLMFVHYANQSINDYFEKPDKNYYPPRSYIQIAMRDELGMYSGRPASYETGVGDGFSYIFDAHRRNDVPLIWVFNGGFLVLVAQDDDKHLQEIKTMIEAGLMDPAIGGFGGHKMLYYKKVTNQYILQHGIDLMQNILGKVDTVFYPNSRIFRASPNVADAIKDVELPRSGGATRVQYVVVDQPSRISEWKPLTVGPLEPQYAHTQLWTQRCQEECPRDGDCTSADCGSWRWLFISAYMKDKFLSAEETKAKYRIGAFTYVLNEYHLGRLGGPARYQLWHLANLAPRVDPARPDAPRVKREPLVVVSCDADHWAGNGWFDGNYDQGRENRFLDKFAAGVEWIAAHPWIQAVTTTGDKAERTLDPDRLTIGSIYLKRAIDPGIEEQAGWEPRSKRPEDQPEATWTPRNFERWRQNWEHFPYAWLGGHRDDGGTLPKCPILGPGQVEGPTLGHVSDLVEHTILAFRRGTPGGDLRPDPTSSLVKLAELTMGIYAHEALWNKQPLELRCGMKAYHPDRKDILEPEDFIITSSMQLRNAHVYLCAAEWEAWAQTVANAPRSQVFRNMGPVVESVGRRLAGSSFALLSAWAIEKSPEVLGLHWDLDILPNVILYNEQLLVVMDQNGGRITHIFAMRGNRAVCVSGTMKSYQFLADGKGETSQPICDGEVLQNTVLTPNHRYVASDVLQTRELSNQISKKKNWKSTDCKTDADGNEYQFSEPAWYFPDNFNRYYPFELDREERTDAVPSVADNSNGISWSYEQRSLTPEQARKLSDSTLAGFRELLEADRKAKIDGKRADEIVDHPWPSFTKQIRLEGSTLSVTYKGVEAGHLAANEFSPDLFSLVMHGKRTRRRPVVLDEQRRGEAPPPRRLEIADEDGGVVVAVELGQNCRFSQETLEEPALRRLTRVLSDCIEVCAEPADPTRAFDGTFSYAITVSTWSAPPP